jgi:hypothetical protein
MITQAIINTAIIFTSMSCLKPFLKPFDNAAFGSHIERSGLFRYTTEQNNSRNQYYELSAARMGLASGRKNEVQQFTRSMGESRATHEDDEVPLTDALRPDGVGHLARVRHGGATEGAGNGKNISKTRSWTVSVDQM